MGVDFASNYNGMETLLDEGKKVVTAPFSGETYKAARPRHSAGPRCLLIFTLVCTINK